jgi:hypothetical protein
MSFRTKISTIVGAVALAACTSQSPQGVEVQGPTGPVASQQGQNARQGAAGQPGQLPADQQQAGQAGSGGQIGVTLDQRQLAQYSINTSNLNWVLTYLDAQPQKGQITFDANGKGQIVAKSLPIGRAGTVTLQIFDGPTLTLSGSQDNVTLSAGANAITLTLKLAASDLTINVALDPSVTAGQATGTSTVVPTATATATPTATVVATSTVIATVTPTSTATATPTVTATSTVTNPPPTATATATTADPIGTWDGQSNQGNAHWQIVPVSGT